MSSSSSSTTSVAVCGESVTSGCSAAAAGGALTEAGADVVGANCGQGIEGYIAVAKRLLTATDLPIWIKPNAGIPKIVDGEVIYETTPEQFAGQAIELIEAGVSFIGGCCGTTPQFIRELNKVLVV